jgi:hypothetical protein
MGPSSVGVGRDAVLAVVEDGEAIAEYPGDQPYPSSLLLEFVGGAALHIVVARDDALGVCVVVTVYRPTREQWAEDWKSRRRP